ncbi:hypothetical protein [Lysobacter gummosus]
MPNCPLTALSDRSSPFSSPGRRTRLSPRKLLTQSRRLMARVANRE